MSQQPNKIICSMIRVSRYYDKKPVLKDISLSYFYGAKIGVLGLNGSGKSSLLRIMAGVDTEFNGQLILSPGYTIGYLEQEPVLNDSKTVREIVGEAVQATIDLMNEFDRINETFAEPMSDDQMERLIERQGEIQEKLDAADAWDLPEWVELACEGIGASAPAIHAGGTSDLMPTGLWRTLRPVVDYDRCNRCWWVCSTFCPDSAIAVNSDRQPVIDYRHCKGCLICVAQCPSHAIEAVPEHMAARQATPGDGP